MKCWTYQFLLLCLRWPIQTKRKRHSPMALKKLKSSSIGTLYFQYLNSLLRVCLFVCLLCVVLFLIGLGLILTHCFSWLSILKSAGKKTHSCNLRRTDHGVILCGGGVSARMWGLRHTSTLCLISLDGKDRNNIDTELRQALSPGHSIP